VLLEELLGYGFDDADVVVAERERVGRDAARRVLDADHASHGPERRLRHRIGQGAGRCSPCQHGRQVHDPAPLRRAHGREHRPGDVHRSAEVGGQRPLPVGIRDLVGGGVRRHAGRVHQHGPLQLVLYARYERVDRGRIGDVERVVGGSRRQRVGICGVVRAQQGVVGRQAPHEVLANATRCSKDHDVRHPVSFRRPARARCQTEWGASLPNGEVRVDQQRPTAFRHRALRVGLLRHRFLPPVPRMQIRGTLSAHLDTLAGKELAGLRILRNER